MAFLFRPSEILFANGGRPLFHGKGNPFIFDWKTERIFMIVVFKHLFYSNYVGLSFWPFIFVKHQLLKSDAALINHERIHLRQQLELLVVPFYVLYALEWLCRTVRYLDGYRAYQNLSFEREAYAHEEDLSYLERRRPFRFMRYY